MAKETQKVVDKGSPKSAKSLLNSSNAQRRASVSTINSVDTSEAITPKSVDANALDEQLLIERNGKFIMVHISKLTLAEKEMYTAQGAGDFPKKKISGKNASVVKSHETVKSRGSTRSTEQKRDNDDRKARSRSSHQSVSRDKTPEMKYSTERRPGVYKLTEEQKQLLRVQKREKDERELNEKRKKQEEEEKKLEECNRAFEAWLRNKREDAHQSRKKGNDSGGATTNDKNEVRTF